MIRIRKNLNADTRTCDYKSVSMEQLLAASEQHIADVRLGMIFLVKRLADAGTFHDMDKRSELGWFHRDFLTGFKEHGWWDNHRRISRHHLLQEDGIPDDVNLIDVLELVVDLVMASKARGVNFPMELGAEVLTKAFRNTVELVKREVTVED